MIIVQGILRNLPRKVRGYVIPKKFDEEKKQKRIDDTLDRLNLNPILSMATDHEMEETREYSERPLEDSFFHRITPLNEKAFVYQDSPAKFDLNLNKDD